MTAETLRKLAATGFISGIAIFGLAACDDAGDVDDPAVEDDGGLEEEPDDGLDDDDEG